MARSSAEITVKGNNVIDVELKFTKNGSGMLKLRLAVERWRKQGETWEKTNTSFVNIQLWGELAEKTAEIVEKGMRCQVTGYLEERTWETDAGEKRYSTQVVANDVLIPVESTSILTVVGPFPPVFGLGSRSQLTPGGLYATALVQLRVPPPVLLMVTV